MGDDWESDSCCVLAAIGTGQGKRLMVNLPADSARAD